jgi:DNA replication protein
MKTFKGFPAKMSFTPVPDTFINNLLPQIEDIGELKVTLYIMEALYNKKGYPRFVGFAELEANASLMANFKKAADPQDELKKALQLAMKRKTIIGLATESGEIYLLNTAADRQAAEKIKDGEIKIAGIKTATAEPVNMQEPVNIFAIYEENIGMLTPMIAEELKDAMKLYPENWIADAIKEAVKQNIRKLSYITAVLERWAKEGRSDGTYKRDSKKDDPEKYTRGEFGRYVRH